MADQIQCRTCDNKILAATAQRNEGLCGSCFNRSQAERQPFWQSGVPAFILMLLVGIFIAAAFIQSGEGIFLSAMSGACIGFFSVYGSVFISYRIYKTFAQGTSTKPKGQFSKPKN